MEPTTEPKMNEQELAEIAKTRATFLAFLNVHFTTLPDATFVQRIRSDEFLSVLQALAGDEMLSADLTTGAALMRDYVRATLDMAVPQLSDALGVDRTRLYRGVSPQYGPPPPNEAVWIKSNDSVSAVLVAIAEVYRQSEMAVAPSAHERLDYIGVELDFHYQLAQCEADAWLAGDSIKARGLLKRQAGFIREHLLQWVPAYIAKALTMVETDFYRGHLKMVGAFLVEEQARLEQLLEETGGGSENPSPTPTST